MISWRGGDAKTLLFAPIRYAHCETKAPAQITSTVVNEIYLPALHVCHVR